MRELPILFSTPMVEAILENRKTMTRRTAGLEQMNLLPDAFYLSGEQHTVNSKEIAFIFKPCIDILNIGSVIVKPKYNKGDHIWVRETYFDTRQYNKFTLFHYAPDFLFKADPDVFIGEHRWKPSMFMPKLAARIWFECTGVRCERLQDITEQDAIDEGIERVGNYYRLYSLDKGKASESTTDSAIASFYSLWNSINGTDAHLINPWVFVYEFKRIEKP